MSNLLYHGLNYRLRRTGGNELGSAASVIAFSIWVQQGDKNVLLLREASVLGLDRTE